MPDAREQELLQQIAQRDVELSQRDAELRQHAAQLARKDEQLAQAKVEIDFLRQKVDALARQLFGKKSEQLDPAQLQLLFQELETPGPALGKESGPQSPAADSARPQAASPRRERTPRLPEHLPVIEEVIEPPVVQAAPEQWRRIGEEVSERLDYEPARFLRRRTVRPKYVRRGELDAVPVIAPLPPCLLERSIATPGLVAQILVAKYCDHLPLYRQESIYQSRHGVPLTRQTMSEWVGLAADWLRLIYEAIRADVLGHGYAQIDETPIRYLAPGHGQTKLGYLWTCHRPGADSVYAWHPSRAATCLDKIVPADFTGTIQCDGYPAYDAFARTRPGQIELAGCWAHVRRKFFEAHTQGCRRARLVLHLLQNLYRTEAHLRESRAGPKLRALTRARESAPIIARLHGLLLHWKKSKRALPKSLLGQAIDYALGQWPSLQLYLQDGRLEIDNNLVENSIRPTALGKKNWLFFGHAQAGERGAVIYTIIESCRRRGLDPFAYLRDVLTRLPSMTTGQIKEVTPAAWAKAQRDAAFQAAA
jgi:transposase